MVEPPSPRQVTVAVVGGGMAGLAAAHAVLGSDPSARLTVFEGSAEVGGKLRLGQVAGVTVDLGAESMLSRRTEATALSRAVGLGDAIVHPAVGGAGVWTRGAIRELPPTVMGIPADLAAAGRSGILGRAAVARAALEPRLPRLDVSEDVGIGAVVANRLGSTVRDRLVEPLLGGVYAGRSDELSLHAALPQIVGAVKEQGGLLAAAASLVVPPRPDLGPVFAGISGGVGRLPRELAQDVCQRGGTIRCNTMVRELTRTASGWQLVVGPNAKPETVDADAVVVATPAGAAARLLRAVAPLAARELSRIEYASMALVTLAVDAGRVDVELAGSGFLVPPIEGRVVKAVTYSSRKWGWLPAHTALIRCSIGRHHDEAELQRDDADLVEATMTDVRAATGLRAPLLEACVTRWGGALPQYAVGHLDRVRRIRAAVDAVRGLEVCGAVFDGVGIPAVVADGQAAATRVLAGLEPVETMDA